MTAISIRLTAATVARATLHRAAPAAAPMTRSRQPRSSRTNTITAPAIRVMRSRAAISSALTSRAITTTTTSIRIEIAQFRASERKAGLGLAFLFGGYLSTRPGRAQRGLETISLHNMREDGFRARALAARPGMTIGERSSSPTNTWIALLPVPEPAVHCAQDVGIIIGPDPFAFGGLGLGPFVRAGELADIGVLARRHHDVGGEDVLTVTT